MHQYWYESSNVSGQQFTNHISGLKGFQRIEQPLVNETSPLSHMSLASQEPSSSWTTQADNKDHTSHGHNGIPIQSIDHDDWPSHEQLANWLHLPEQPGSTSLPQKQLGAWMPPVEHDDWESVEQPANWPQLPNHPGFAPQGNHTPWVQPIPINHAGKIAQGQGQGQPPGWALPPGNMGFNAQKPSFPWGQLHPVHPAGIGMPAHGHLAALPQHPISPFGYGYGANANGQQANWNGFGNPAGWGGQGHPMGWGAPWAPMGWGNNQGKGQPGILEGLLKVGKGTMGGIGMISGLIGMGKFLF